MKNIVEFDNPIALKIKIDPAPNTPANPVPEPKYPTI